MAANYNNSAWFYDRLSRLVYGKALINTQIYLLNYIPPHSKVLIIGGGTGWILEELAKLHTASLHITYVEVAPNMMHLSKKRNIGKNEVIYINEAIEKVSLPADFDVVITPFLFDNFVEETTEIVFNHVNALLKPNGQWLNADFQLTGKWWQLLLLKSMFIFFRLLCRIEASKLPAIEKQFTSKGYKTVAEKTFFNDFMIATVYRKQ